MSTSLADLAVRYQHISECMMQVSIMRRSSLLLQLAADYRYVAQLLDCARLDDGLTCLLIAELRRHLNRSLSYANSEKRNKVLDVVAKTIERTKS